MVGFVLKRVEERELQVVEGVSEWRWFFGFVFIMVLWKGELRKEFDMVFL